MEKSEMPKTCADCDYFHGEWGICKRTGHGNKFDSEGNRFIDCPLVNENQNTKIKKEIAWNTDIKLSCKYYDVCEKKCSKGENLDCENCIKFRTF